MSVDSFDTRRTLRLGDRTVAYFSLPALADRLGVALDRMPFSLRVLLENLLRNEDGKAVTVADVEALARWPAVEALDREVSFYPARVLMPDSSGIPLLIDLAAMRDAVAAQGLDPRRVNPRIPTDLVIDHSVRADVVGSPDAIVQNMKLEMQRNRERYTLVRWAMGQFDNLRVIPPGNGILHQLNLECLASVVATRDGVAFPDTLVGMDSHTPMINGLGVFGWGVGGIEAATAMLGDPVSLLVPRVVGCRLVGKRRPGVVCTDIVLSLTQVLRRHGVLAAIVEFCGPGLADLSAPDRATIANMAAEYGATMGFFPWDAETVRYLALSGRPAEQLALVEAYAKANRLWRDTDPVFQDVLEFDLGSVEPSLAGPTRPEARVGLAGVAANFRDAFPDADVAEPDVRAADRTLRHGDIVIAAISSCTNTGNPFQIIAAGLLARNAAARGVQAKPWVKTSLSPGSRVVTAMLQRAGLQQALDAIGFHTVGYGCMTCGGGAGSLADAITQQIATDGLNVVGVISTNRNFEGRLHPSVRGAYLASPPLVVAYALAGSVLHDVADGVLGFDAAGNPVRLRDLWPSDAEVNEVMAQALTADVFRAVYSDLADGGPEWAALPAADAPVFAWDPASLYLKRPPFLEGGETPPAASGDIAGARALLVLGDDVTTDHISPGGAIPADAPAGQYLIANGIQPAQFSTYVARRANHEVMVRGTFANIRLRNKLAPDTEGGFTRYGNEITTVHDAAERYRAAGVSLIVVAGSNYGCGSSRDWAAKGSRLLGIQAVVAESFERIHRSNLVGMGVLPLQLPPDVTADSLRLDGSETFDITGLSGGVAPGAAATLRICRASGETNSIPLTCRVDTSVEADWLRHGGILPNALRSLTVDTGAIA
ncbi:MAG: aconitate hydratase AcnA [Acetobacteraceae bacterium]